MKRLAIIPARSGSSRIKNKNFKLIGGKPIISYTLDNLIKSKLFDRIHISSDIDIKKKKINNNKIDFFIRPKKLANDNVGINDVIKWVLEEYLKIGLKFDTICVAYATAPLLESQDFIKACQIFERTKKDRPLLSVCELKPSLDEVLTIHKDILKPLSKKTFYSDSKKHKKYFYDTASFLFANNKHFFNKNKKNIFIKYELDRYKGIDINDKNDFKFLKKIFDNKL